jgi:hypothetical protein
MDEQIVNSFSNELGECELSILMNSTDDELIESILKQFKECLIKAVSARKPGDTLRWEVGIDSMKNKECVPSESERLETFIKKEV